MSFLKSFAKSVCSRPFLAMSSALVMVAGMLFGANIATADSVWVQSYERSSQTQVCEAQPGETPWQESWGTDSSWSPSWEMWANNGSGGWTCTRSITWARNSGAPTNASSNDPVSPVTCTEPVGGAGVACAVGKIGPGGGLVFLISGGLTYEMAPKTWGAAEVTPVNWCNDVLLDVPGAVGREVGDGSANTIAIDAACTSGAGQLAADYSANGLSDWFLPSQDELNAMCNYSRNPSAPALPTVLCTGVQNGGFASGAYGFVALGYWSSSQFNNGRAWTQGFIDGNQGANLKDLTMRVRPVRAF